MSQAGRERRQLLHLASPFVFGCVGNIFPKGANGAEPWKYFQAAQHGITPPAN